MNTSNNNIVEFFIEKFEALKAFVRKNIKIVLPVAVAILIIVVVVIAMAAHNKKVKLEMAAEVTTEEEETTTIDTSVMAVPEIPLEEDAYPAITELIYSYNKGMASGDLNKIRKINNNIDATEAIRIEETAKYVDSYVNTKVYTKVGPVEGSYIAYVYSEIKFYDYENTVPGMFAYYICTDEEGNLYINDGEESDSVINYIREVSLQDDVKDLNNTAAVAYNDAIAADEELLVFLVDLTQTIDTAVGESLAQAEGTVEEKEEEEEPEEEPAEAETTTETVIKVKATTTVNVRSSDSETADKLGKASEGEEFKLIEERGNGWSEIEYNGKSAFIKSEFLTKSSTETAVNVNNDTSSTETKTTDTKTTDSGSTKVSGTVMVKENVRIRASASEDGEKIATAYMGQKLDLVEKLANGWTKIKYNGQIAYVKSDYVE